MLKCFEVKKPWFVHEVDCTLSYRNEGTLGTYSKGLPVLFAHDGESVCVGSDVASKVLGNIV